MDIPMLDEDEYKIAQQLYKKGFRNRKNFKDRKIQFKELLDFYKEITGFEETEPNAIMHHRIEEIGPDCPKCRKPLRKKQARYCVACGFGKEDLTSSDTKPLVERRPDLFEKEN